MTKLREAGLFKYLWEHKLVFDLCGNLRLETQIW